MPASEAMNEAIPDYAIFISYRRAGGAHYARILKAELEKRGYLDRVFMDYDELKDGRFDSRIERAIEAAPVFIFILSPGSLDRCVEEGDWVGREIIHAARCGRHIIPVNFDNLFKGFPSGIPAEIEQAIGQHQFTKIDSEQLLNESVEKLIRDRIAPVIEPGTLAPSSGTGAEITIIADADCRVLRFHKLLATVGEASEKSIKLLRGNHLLEFVSTECPEIRRQIRYNVPDNDYTDFIEIALKESIEKYRQDNRLIRVMNPEGKWGYIDKTGREIIACQYSVAGEFSEGLASVQDEAGKYGAIDPTGNVVLPFIYECLGSFKNGLADMENSDECFGFIDKTGKQVLPCIYDDIAAGDFGMGLVCVLDGESDKWGFIDRTGKKITPFIYDDADDYGCNRRLFKVTIDDKVGLVDLSGRQIAPCRYKYIGSFNEGLAPVKDLSGKWGYIDERGQEAIPCVYQDAGGFGEGLALVASNGKWGYVDKNGRKVISCVYSEAGVFSEGLARVNKDGKWGYIDKSGKETIPCIYDSSGPFSEGLAEISIGRRSGYIDKSGKQAIPCIYENALSFHNGLAIVMEYKGSVLCGLIDRQGNLVVPFKYASINYDE